WHDPETAYRIVSCVERNFLRDRRAAATDPITDTIKILNDEESRQHEVLAAALAEAQALRPSEAAPGRRGKDAQGTKELAVRHREAAEMARPRRVAELRAQLLELRITYAPAHPLVVAMEERIRQAEAPLTLSGVKQNEARPGGAKSFLSQGSASQEV